MRLSDRKSQVRSTRLLLEQLEQRYLLAADSPALERIEAFTALDNFQPSEQPSSPAAARGVSYELSSKPGSDFTIYLDYDGHITEGTSWNSNYGVETIVHPPYDINGQPDVLSSTEMDNIIEAWRRTAEDFAPFGINVTTVEPPLDALINTGSGDDAWGVRVVMTSDSFADCGCGGHAFIGSFNDDVDTPALVYNSGRDSLGETVAHEVGHTIFLSHDGLSSTTYYPGHGAGVSGWGAIMGAPFDKNTTQWDRGEYFDANNGGSGANYGNGPDDLEVITTQNGFDYRGDDHGDDSGSATELGVSQGAGTSALLSGYGIIERNTDVDVFEFETGAGLIDLDILPIAERSNVDLWAGVYDEAGTLVAQSNRSNDHTAGFSSLSLAEGRYFLKIDGIGSSGVYNPATDSVEDPTGSAPWQNSSPTGYSNYGSLGQYWISGDVVQLPTSAQLQITETVAQVSEGNAGTTQVTFDVTRGGNLSQAAAVSYRVVPAAPTSVGETTPYSVDAEDFVGSTLPTGTVMFGADVATQSIVLDLVGDTQYEPDEVLTVELFDESDPLYLVRNTAAVTVVADETQYALDETAGFHLESDPIGNSGIAVRWRQVRFSGEGFDEWAVDNVSFSAAPFADDFDPTVDSDLWGQITGAQVNSSFGGTGNSLFFTGADSRTATSPLLAATPGDTMQFDLIIGNSANGGDRAESGEDVVLEYSTNNGVLWTELTRYAAGTTSNWTTFSVPLPSAITMQEVESYEIEVVRSGDVSSAATIDWDVVPLGGQPTVDGADFVGQTLPGGMIQFASGEPLGTATLTIRPDTDLEPNERFLIQLSDPSGAFASIDPGFESSLQIIADDESQVSVKGDTWLRWTQNDNSGSDFDEWALDEITVTNGPVDDFDPDIDLAQWSLVSGGSVNQTFGGGSNSLFFSGSDPREIVSNALSPVAGDSVEFDLILGNSSNGGDNVESGEGVSLEYSVDDRTSWQTIGFYDDSAFDAWTTLSEVLPTGALADVREQNETDAGALSFQVGVVRGGNLDKFVVLDWSVVGSGANPAAANDFVGAVLPTGSLTFNPGQSLATAEFFVAGDSQSEADETFDFQITAASGGPWDPTPVTGTILNDDEATLLGDLDHDGTLDCDDVDELGAAIAAGSTSAMFDLNDSGTVDVEDLHFWVVTLKGTLLGDANLDFAVDRDDYQIWNANRFQTGLHWCSADFDGNGLVDGQDLLIWNANKFLTPGVVQSHPAVEVADLDDTGGELNGGVNSTVTDETKVAVAAKLTTRLAEPTLAAAGYAVGHRWLQNGDDASAKDPSGPNEVIEQLFATVFDWS